MQSVYEKIDAIFADELDTPPVWAQELMGEIQQLKALVEKEEQRNVKRDKFFYAFIKAFRLNMRADTEKKRYPKILDHKGRKLGVNFDGLLYDVNSSKLLSTQEAFKVYGYLYKKRDFEVFY